MESAGEKGGDEKATGWLDHDKISRFSSVKTAENDI